MNTKKIYLVYKKLGLVTVQKFCFAGGLGFLTDLSILYLLTKLMSMNPYQARLLSFSCAVFTTWLMNRNLTFSRHSSVSIKREWIEYFATSCIAGVLNYFIYSMCLVYSTYLYRQPGIALVIATVPSMFFNFIVYKFFVFR